MCPVGTLLWAVDRRPGSLCLLRVQGEPGSPIHYAPPGPGRGLLDGEKCNVSSCWWGLHSFLVKYCAWKTRIYGQHSSYKQSNCTLWRNCFATIGGRLPWLLPPPSACVVPAAAYVELGSPGTRQTRGCRGSAVSRLCFHWDLARAGLSLWDRVFLRFLGHRAHLLREVPCGSPGGSPLGWGA